MKKSLTREIFGEFSIWKFANFGNLQILQIWEFGRKSGNLEKDKILMFYARFYDSYYFNFCEYFIDHFSLSWVVLITILFFLTTLSERLKTMTKI